MLNTLKKMTIATVMSTTFFATPLYAEELQDVSEIKVLTSYASAEDSNAQALFPEITDDIKLAIAELVPLSNNAADPIIRVDIRKVALNGDTLLPDSKEFNQLEGVVAIETNTGEGGRTFPVRIHAQMDETAVPEGYVVIAPSFDDFYKAMVAAFAENVAEGLAKIPS